MTEEQIQREIFKIYRKYMVGKHLIFEGKTYNIKYKMVQWYYDKRVIATGWSMYDFILEFNIDGITTRIEENPLVDCEGVLYN